MLSWNCPCCAPFDFDPVDLPSRASHRPKRQLHSQACAASPVVENLQKNSTKKASQQRNVVAVGLQRFAEGALQPQPDWEQLTDRVVCVLAQNPGTFTLNGTNCYLVGTGRKRLLVDTGEQHFGADAFMDILDTCMAALGVDGLDGIIITHMHHDHYGNVGRLQQKYGAIPVYSRELSHRTFPLLAELRRRGQIQHFLSWDGKPRYNPKVDPKPPKLPEDLDLSWARDRVKHFAGKTTYEKMQWIFFMTWNHQDLIDRLRSCEYPWTAIQTGDTISTEGATLTAMHMPGHSDDHMAFLLEEEHSLFSGDHVLGWGTTFILDMKDYMESLRKMLHMQPVSLFPGHGHFIEDGVDVLQRYISHRQTREEQHGKHSAFDCFFMIFMSVHHLATSFCFSLSFHFRLSFLFLSFLYALVAWNCLRAAGKRGIHW